ncbi:alpha/beta hydrolase [Streptomyces sp. NPDC059506]|uniref:alpha/beta hydrolase n=1 Tax=Streptomyces sp. NPDC059506 TaxID=3347751 RepID=UPI00367945D2
MQFPRPFRATGTALALAGLLLAGCSSSQGPSGADTEAFDAPHRATAAVNRVLEPLPSAVPGKLRPYYEQKLVWKSCDTPEFQCATMKAPLDYDAPGSGKDVTLEVSRKRATGPGKRLGALLVNPGGPGSSAIEYMRYAAVTFPAPVRARYDIAAVDPRGVGRSEPVRCLTGREMDAFTAADTTPDDRGEKTALVRAYKEFAQGCEEKSSRLLPHVGTVESARDMDILRALLGDGKLTYVGKSYGTFLGATYAGLFPGRVGRLVLDGAMDPTLSAREISRTQGGGFEEAFTAFAEDCTAREDCPLGDSVEEAGKQLDDLLRGLDAEPLPADGGRRLGEALGTTGVLSAMYAESWWGQLRAALKQADAGNGSGLLALSDAYYDRAPDGEYGNLMYANAAVNCLDLPPAAQGPKEVETAVGSFEKTSPRFGRYFAWASLMCAYWPVEPTGEPRRIEAKGAAPIVVVGTTRDPATPYRWAVSLADQLDSGRLLTYDGDGHTAYAQGDDCVDTAVNRYLLEGDVWDGEHTCD